MRTILSARLDRMSARTLKFLVPEIPGREAKLPIISQCRLDNEQRLPSRFINFHFRDMIYVIVMTTSFSSRACFIIPRFIIVEAIIYQNSVTQTANQLLLSNFPVLPAVSKHFIDSYYYVSLLLYSLKLSVKFFIQLEIFSEILIGELENVNGEC